MHGSLSDHLRPTQVQTFKSKDERTPNDLSHYRLHEFALKRYFWFESCVIYKCSGLVSLFFKWWVCHFKTLFFSCISYNQNLELWHGYSKAGSGGKTAQRLLNSCSEVYPVQFCESSIVENIPTALNTDVRCSLEVTKIIFSVEMGDM